MEEMTYKIVFFDVDGTLINYENGAVEESTRQAIHLLQDKGIHLVAATGRPLSMCEGLKSLGIETFITANGAYVNTRMLSYIKFRLKRALFKMFKLLHSNNSIP